MTDDPIIDQITKITTDRSNRILCIFNCVNLNLKVIHTSHNQNNEVSKGIALIGEKLPNGFRRNKNDYLNFHSFVVSHYFITLIAEFEGFLVDILRTIVKRFPAKVGNMSIKVSEIAICGSLDEVIAIGIDRFINDLTFKRPKEYIETLQEIFSLNKDDFKDLWPELIERKARRDLGVHNDWRKNEIYIRKIKEVGIRPTDDDFLAPDNEYFVESVDIVRNILNKIAIHCADKFASKDYANNKENF